VIISFSNSFIGDTVRW